MKASNSFAPLYTIERLEKKHEKDRFDCGVKVLNDYLKQQAGQDIRKNVAVSYVLTSVKNVEVLGYYTLSSMGIVPGDLPEDTIKKLPRYPVLPGILLGRLAVDQNIQKEKLGVYLLLDALKRSLILSQQIGIVAVIVDVKNEKAAGFYKHCGFIAFPNNSKKLFLPIGTIQAMGL